MPHIVVKLYSGRTEQQKAALAKEITKTVMASLGKDADAVSVGIEDVAEEEWVEGVYNPDIIGKSETLYKKPGYGPCATS